MEFLAWIEETRVSVWVRESPSLLAFPGILVLHTIGLGFLVGASVAIDLRLLGVARSMPLAPMARFFPVFWTGFAVNAASGVLLLLAFPAKALTDPVFYIKLVLIALAVAVAVRLRDVLADPRLGVGPPPASAKALAALSLMLWMGAITCGRLLAYTYSRLMALD